MLLADFLYFTYGSLRAHRLRTLLTALGIAVGIASVILLTSIGEGLHRFVVAEFTQFGTNLISVTPGRTQTHGASLGSVNTVRPLSIEDALALKRARYVQVSDPVVQGNADVKYFGKSRRVTLYGVGPDFAEALKMRVAVGEFLPQEDPRSARALAVLEGPGATRVRADLTREPDLDAMVDRREIGLAHAVAHAGVGHAARPVDAQARYHVAGPAAAAGLERQSLLGGENAAPLLGSYVAHEVLLVAQEPEAVLHFPIDRDAECGLGRLEDKRLRGLGERPIRCARTRR